MAVTLQFLAGAPTKSDLQGNALAFFGPGTFGAPIGVGQWNDNLYVSDPTGSTQGIKCSSTKYADDYNATLGTGDTHSLLDLPNDLAPLMIRLTSDVPCTVRNATFTFYDRNDVTMPPIGATLKAFEIVHPSSVMNPQAPAGTGSTRWATPGGAGGSINGRTYDVPMALTPSPGPNSANATSQTPVASATHEWFLGMSASPDSNGTKTSLALWVTMEYV